MHYNIYLAVLPKLWQVGKFGWKLVVDGTKTYLHTKFHVNRCFHLPVVSAPNSAPSPPSSPPPTPFDLNEDHWLWGWNMNGISYSSLASLATISIYVYIYILGYCCIHTTLYTAWLAQGCIQATVNYFFK